MSTLTRSHDSPVGHDEGPRLSHWGSPGGGPMADRQLRILGPVELWSADGRVELAGRRQRAVLARLASARGAVVSTERLITDIWNGHPPDHALGVLQAHVSTLRRLLEPDRAPRTPPARLVTRQPGYALSLPTDGDRFDELVTQAIAQLGAGHAGAAAATLDGALALWSGDAYADLSDEPWLAPEIQRLSELRLIAREQGMEAALQLGQLQTAIPELRQLAEENPLREELWRLLALALYRSGRQADALAALRQARSLLAEELGLDPGRALQDLEAAVLAQDDRVLLGIGAPPEPTPMPALGSVPGQRTGGRPMIGRRDALDWIDHAAAEVVSGRQRMVVVTGEAGIGKTRLAETATETLRGQGWLVVWGRCYESSGAPPLWPWAQVLRELDAVVPLPPALTDLQAGNPGGDATEIAEARFRQQQAVAGYLAEVAGRACLAVLLEAAQWADAASLSLLAALPDPARSARILALVTARGDEAAPAQASALDRLSRHEPVRLALDGLTAADVADLIALYRRITGGQGLDAEALRRRTGG